MYTFREDHRTSASQISAKTEQSDETSQRVSTCLMLQEHGPARE